MGFGTVLAVAVALAMDAFAVAVASGINLRTVTGRQTFRLAWHFGLFQAVMPVLGWLGGETITVFMRRFDHWIAFALLTAIGARMIYGAFSKRDETGRRVDPTRGGTMVMLSVATSLDALAVGLSLSLLRVSIWWPALAIGLVAGLFTIAGLHLGRLIGRSSRLGPVAECAGGLVLIAIGADILLRHGL